MTKQTDVNQRINLSLPPELLREIEEVAEEHQTTVTNVVRKSIKLLLVAEKAKKRGGGLYLRDQDRKPQQIEIFGL